MVYPLAEKYLRISGKTVEELAEEVGTSRSTMYYLSLIHISEPTRPY